MKPHKHADLIKAWADGVEIEIQIQGEWRLKADWMGWYPEYEYRIKPIPKPDVVKYVGITFPTTNGVVNTYISDDPEVIDHWTEQLKLTIDGETGKLKAVEIVQ